MIVIHKCETGEVLARLEIPKHGQKAVRHKNLTHADLRKTDWSGFLFHRVILHKADLREAKLTKSVFDHVKLKSADLTGACLEDAIFCESDLTDALMSHCSLVGADLSGTRMPGVRLNGADLRRITIFCPKGLHSLRDVDLRDSRLDGAKLINVDLTGAKLQGTSMLAGGPFGLDMVLLTNAGFNSKTRWPSGFNPIRAGAVEQD